MAQTGKWSSWPTGSLVWVKNIGVHTCEDLKESCHDDPHVRQQQKSMYHLG